MNFIEAVKLAKEGKQIRIPSWSDGVSAYISDLNEEEGFCGLYWKNKDISHLIRFIPNVRSILADDWEIYEEEPKTYSFQEALKALEEGKKISRPFELAPGRKRTLRKIVNDDGSFIMYADDGKKEYQIYKLDQFSFYYTDIVATDWIIEE